MPLPEDPKKVISAVLSYFGNSGEVDYTDGASMSFKSWRFNIRQSNTEPLVRLNIESKGDKNLIKKKLKLISELIFKNNQRTADDNSINYML